ncbi:DUF3784 domain-containing protein [Spirosoma oryzicola]|uniref:DUF3784 domain-containing protein n=1 Tax=Spirosoma oryzicola TaxID=2898794 RepID=UPI001E44B73F|nr:DUF3784 domain-containing protein [Spirosoma oryzicola]UHG93943.1 DUF3784 domain-containing protein [Spirosoma oryzicola]
MLIVACVLSIIFGSLGFIVTKSNAQYILAGYNTMSEQDRQAVSIDAYLKFFKRFHLTLALSLLGGVWLLSLKNNNWASLFMTVYPLVAYLYFLIRGTSFYQGPTQQKVGSYLTVGLLVLVIVVLIISSLKDLKSSELILNRQTLEIAGSYGFVLNRHDVYKQKLVNQLPPIAYKANGFAAGDYAKGRFKTKDGRAVWLFVNKQASPFLLITSAKGDIYYNHDKTSVRVLSQQLARWLEAQ